MKRIGIIGAGRFGLSLAESLAEAGQEVLLIERNGAIVQNARDIVDQAVQGDATNERTLDEAGLRECDVAVVAIGSNVEASTLATANCKELGIPIVTAKAHTVSRGRSRTVEPSTCWRFPRAAPSPRYPCPRRASTRRSPRPTCATRPA